MFSCVSCCIVFSLALREDNPTLSTHVRVCVYCVCDGGSLTPVNPRLDLLWLCIANYVPKPEHTQLFTL